MSKSAVPHKQFQTGYGRKHTVIKDNLYLYLFWVHTEMSCIVKVRMSMTISDVFDLAVVSYFSVIDGSGGSLSTCCSVVTHRWAASIL